MRKRREGGGRALMLALVHAAMQAPLVMGQGRAYAINETGIPGGLEVWATDAAYTDAIIDDPTGFVPTTSTDVVTARFAKNEYEVVTFAFTRTIQTLNAKWDCSVRLPPDPGSLSLTLYTVKKQGGMRRIPPNIHAAFISVHESDVTNVLWLDLYAPPGTASGIYPVRLSLQCRDEQSRLSSFGLTVLAEVYNFTLSASLNFVQDVTSEIPKTQNYRNWLLRELYNHRAVSPRPEVSPLWVNLTRVWNCTTESIQDEMIRDPPCNGLCQSPRDNLLKYVRGNKWRPDPPDTPGAPCPGFPVVRMDMPVAELCGVRYDDDAALFQNQLGRLLLELSGWANDVGITEQLYLDVSDTERGVSVKELCSLVAMASSPLRLAIHAPPSRRKVEAACGFDIWVTNAVPWNISTYHDAAQRLGSTHGEELWLEVGKGYPFSSPTVDNDAAMKSAMGTRMLGFIAWTQRMRGIVVEEPVYSATGKPTMAAKLLREAAEDYEYLWLLNDMKHPEPCVETLGDLLAYRLTTGLDSWSKDPASLAGVRQYIGEILAGTRATNPAFLNGDPLLQFPTTNATYYYNFRDASLPVTSTDNPLLKTVPAWTTHTKGYWSSSKNGGVGWLVGTAGGHVPLEIDQKLFDDNLYGTAMGSNTSDLIQFRFDTPPGVYNVSVAAGTATGTPTVMVNGHVAIAGDATAAQIEGFVSVMSHGSIIVTVHGERNENNHLVVYPSLCYVVAVPAKDDTRADVMDDLCGIVDRTQVLPTTRFPVDIDIDCGARPLSTASSSSASTATLPLPSVSLSSLEGPGGSKTSSSETNSSTADLFMTAATSTTSTDATDTHGPTPTPRTYPPDPVEGPAPVPTDGAAEAEETKWISQYWWILAAGGGCMIFSAVVGLVVYARMQKPDFTGRVPIGEFLANPELEKMAQAPAACERDAASMYLQMDPQRGTPGTAVSLLSQSVHTQRSLLRSEQSTASGLLGRVPSQPRPHRAMSSL